MKSFHLTRSLESTQKTCTDRGTLLNAVCELSHWLKSVLVKATALSRFSLGNVWDSVSNTFRFRESNLSFSFADNASRQEPTSVEENSYRLTFASARIAKQIPNQIERNNAVVKACARCWPRRLSAGRITVSWSASGSAAMTPKGAGTSVAAWARIAGVSAMTTHK